MKKANFSSSNNSGTSSETSETQSVEDSSQGVGGVAAQSGTNLNRVTRTTKRMKDQGNEKDGESKRPPWRAVSVSTLPKPDKNALLRARLLDASRRLRAGKIAVAVQTDIVPTKLMKEVKIGPQTDLILYKEVGILTDGFYTKRTEGSDEFILTYSVSQMTEHVPLVHASTQTLLPKVPGDDFMEAYLSGGQNVQHINQFSKTERKLLDQICKMRQSQQLVPALPPGHSFNSETDTTETSITVLPSQPNIAGFARIDARPTLLTPTLSSWHFEYDDLDARGNYSMPYIISAHRPWNSFTPVPYGGANFDWNLLMVAIDELIVESNRLIDIIENVSVSRRENYNAVLNQAQQLVEFKPQQVSLPSEHWLPLIEQQEKELKAMTDKLQHPQIQRTQVIEKLKEKS